MDKIREIAKRLVAWYESWDFYDFIDCYGDRQNDPLEDTVRCLRDREQRNGIAEYLHGLIDEEPEDWSAEEIATLYRQIVAL